MNEIKIDGDKLGELRVIVDKIQGGSALESLSRELGDWTLDIVERKGKADYFRMPTEVLELLEDAYGRIVDKGYEPAQSTKTEIGAMIGWKNTIRYNIKA